MGDHGAAVLLALLGAACFAVASVLQHHEVRAGHPVEHPDRGRDADAGLAQRLLPARHLLGIMQRPRWLAGLGIAGLGAVVHAVALLLAPLRVVQPVGVLAVPLAVLIAAARTRRRPAAGVVVGTTTSIVGVVVFVATSAGSAASRTPARGATLVVVLGVLGVVVLLAAAGLTRSGTVRCVALATAGASAFGLVSALVRVLSQLVATDGLAWGDHRVLGTVGGLVAALAVGGWLVQQAYHAGSPEVVIACLTVVDPIVAVLVGALLLGEGAATPAATWTLLAAAAAAATAGVLTLAHHHPDAVRARALTREPALAHPRPRELTVTALRLLIGAETYPPDVNGAARFAGRLATGLAARGHEVHVVAPSPTGPPGVVEVDGVTVHRVSSTRYGPLEAMRVCTPWDAARETARIVREIDPDVVHTQGHLAVGRGVVHAARRSGRRIVATNHLMPENVVGYLPLPAVVRDAVGRWMWRDLGRVYGHAQVVTAPTPRAVELLTERAGIAAAVAVSNGIDTDRFRPRPHGLALEPTILFVGRLDPEKRVDELLRAVAALPSTVRCRVEVVGEGPRRTAWAALAADLGIADRVRFRGLVTDDELLECYARADLFCMPGVAELQSLVTLEAMAAGLPVVAADAMALPHLVRPGVNGRLYRPGDVTELSGHLADLLADPGLRHRHGRASRGIVAEHTVDATLGAYEAVYARALDREPVTADRSAFPGLPPAASPVASRLPQQRRRPVRWDDLEPEPTC
ncbi:glycosyltransferase [Cellulomonas phragmiteti]|uniref:D-inositol 3-phosphate glycosyltransferase n=1 Tax=Cellulomonas phragmiteti TaxID=478780 RepID=A0ABQ4DK17_9CELL|nr:glycosyltransferase [Cellulomonas phragmiteti]GIG39337.1 glucosyltransferase [Cellulomonas phragmiteti]